MIPKQFDAISKADIDALVSNAVAEDRNTEYKRELPGSSDDEKREFLADVSSLANAAAGDILYGVAEDKGVPVSADGLPGIDPDKEILRLEEMVRNGVQPRVPGVQIKAVPGFPQGPVIVLRVPKSWSAPHMVIYKNLSRFYSRNSAGKYQLDVTEIRSAFVLSEAIPERIRRFRDDRLGKLVADETPVRLISRSRLALHVVPLASLLTAPLIDVAIVPGHQMPPLGEGRGWSNRLNLDGFVTFTGGQLDEDQKFGYVQLFRNGMIEAVETVAFRLDGQPPEYIGPDYEVDVVERLPTYFELLKGLSLSPPIWVGMAMTGVRGLRMATRSAGFFYTPGVDRDVIVLPDVVVDDYAAKPEDFMKPSFDAVWQAAGHRGSNNYNTQGQWGPSR